MAAFIDAHRDTYGVEPICDMLPMAPSTYYATKAREAEPARRPARTQRDDRLREEIKRVWRANRRVYGVRKVWRQLARRHRGRAVHGGAADARRGTTGRGARSARAYHATGCSG